MYEFLAYRKIDEDDAQMLMDWRSSPHVASHMLTQIVPDLDQQRQWVRTCNARNDYAHRIIQIEGRDVGYCSITVTDEEVGQLGVYVGELSTPRQLSIYNFLGTTNQALFTMGLKKLVNQVMRSNARTVKLQAFNGYLPAADAPPSQTAADVLWFELTRERWHEFRKRFGYDKDWDGNPTGISQPTAGIHL
jgi:hypothetical protein